MFPTFEGTTSTEVDSNNEYVQHAVAMITKLLGKIAPFPMKTEYSARLYIDTILLAAGLFAGGLEMSVEQMYESPMARGPPDNEFYDNAICVRASRKARRTALLMALHKILRSSVL